MTEQHSEVQLLPFGTQVKGASSAAFVCLYARDCRPYDIDHSEIPAEIRALQTNKFLLFSRHNTVLGWPGGGVEETDFEGAKDFADGLRQAAKREMFQETGFAPQIDLLEPVCSHYIPGKNKTVHLFGYPIDYEGLKNVARAAPHQPHFYAEATGVILPTTLGWKRLQVPDAFDHNQGIFTLFRHVTPSSFREELFETLDHLKLAGQDVLDEIAFRYMSGAYMRRRALIPPPAALRP